MRLITLILIASALTAGTYDATVTGTITYTTGTSGFGSEAGGFVTNTNYALTPSGLAYTAAPFTIDARVSISVKPSAGNYYAIAGSGSQWLGVNSSGQLFCSTWASGTWGSAVIVAGITDITDGLRHHVACALENSTTIKVFVDGALQTTDTRGTFAAGGVTQFRLGDFQGVPGFAWPGKIDELAFWSIAKYTAGFTPPTSPYTGSESGIKALFHFDGNANDSVTAPAFGAGSLSAGTVTSSTVPLSWTASTNCAGSCLYEIQQASSVLGSCGSYTNILTGSSALSTTATGLTAGSTYCFRLRAYDSGSGGANSILVGPINATTTSGTLPYTPTTVTVAGGESVTYAVPNANSAAGAYSSGAASVTLLIYHHGAGEGCGYITNSDKTAVVAAVANAGFIALCSTARGDNWGTIAAVRDYDLAYADAKSRYPNITRVVGLCQSMGCLTAMASIARGYIPYSGLAAIFPVVSLNAIYTNSAQPTYASLINAAWGITGTSPNTYALLTAGADPLVIAAQNPIAFRHTPMVGWQSAADTVTPRANHWTAFRNLAYQSTWRLDDNACTGDHGDASCFQPSAIMSFFTAALAATPATTGLIGGGQRFQ